MHVPPIAKAELRRRAQQARGALGANHRTEASAAICDHLLTLPEVAQARAVAGYASTGSEVDLDPVLVHLLREGRAVALPWVDGPAIEMALVGDLSGDLVAGWRGVREPRQALRTPVPPGAVDLVLVPGLAFDRSGTRLGYGGGHFDRFLARVPAETPVIGAAFAVQVLDHLPREDHDVSVHAVVTESGVLRTR